jgi:hypothetical protein
VVINLSLFSSTDLNLDLLFVSDNFKGVANQRKIIQTLSKKKDIFYNSSFSLKEQLSAQRLQIETHMPCKRPRHKKSCRRELNFFKPFVLTSFFNSKEKKNTQSYSPEQ